MYLLLLGLVWLIAAQHLLFMLLEMLYWQKPLGRRIFHTTESFARDSRVLAASQGLYNGFLAAGLIWTACYPELDRLLFFLLCVLIAGVFGGLTANRNIFLIQGLPALVALVLLVMVWE
jgi:putative membrane protein